MFFQLHEDNDSSWIPCFKKHIILNSSSNLSVHPSAGESIYNHRLNASKSPFRTNRYANQLC